MNEELTGRVKAAAIAGWWTLLIVTGFVSIQWLAYLWIISARPAWMLRLWGSGIAWSTVQTVWVWSVAVFKICIWLLAVVVIWLSLWAHRLRKG